MLGAQLDGALTVVIDDLNEYCWWYRIVDGRVVEIIEYLDTELVTTVLGR